MIIKKQKFKYSTDTNDPKIVFEEKRSKITFDNPQRNTYTKVDVDGKEITQGKRCDYLLVRYDSEPNEEYFIELKGCNIEHAIEQLQETIKILSSDFKLPKYAFIIASKVSYKINTKIQNSKKNLLKKFTAKLIIKEKEYTYNLSSSHR